MTWKYTGHLTPQIKFCGTMSQNSVAPIKPGWMASLCYMLKSRIIFWIYENVYLKLFIRICCIIIPTDKLIFDIQVRCWYQGCASCVLQQLPRPGDTKRGERHCVSFVAEFHCVWVLVCFNSWFSWDRGVVEMRHLMGSVRIGERYGAAMEWEMTWQTRVQCL